MFLNRMVRFETSDILVQCAMYNKQYLLYTGVVLSYYAIRFTREWSITNSYIMLRIIGAGFLSPRRVSTLLQGLPRWSCIVANRQLDHFTRLARFKIIKTYVFILRIFKRKFFARVPIASFASDDSLGKKLFALGTI